MIFLPATYDLRVVGASLFIAVFSSYVALDLVKRVRERGHRRRVAMIWLIGGSVAMGTGVWCTHFMGMLALSLPIALGYGAAMTVLSWCAAVAASLVALYLASHGVLGRTGLAGGALVMGAGITAMHYGGMSALDMAPGIVWDPRLVSLSVLVAVGASAAALVIFHRLDGLAGQRGKTFQVLAALVMGLAVCAMHYTGMAAAGFPTGTICLSARALSGEHLGLFVSLLSLCLLLTTLLVSIVDDQMQSALKLTNLQLQSANEELRQLAFMDRLTGLPNRLQFEDRLAQAAARADGVAPSSRRGAGRLAVLFIDLDGFKPVNDSFGHAAGDQLLKEVARRLQATASPSHTLARIGGDEFVLLMDDVANLTDCALLASRLLVALAGAYAYDEQHVSISASIGIAVYPDHGERERLVARADAAMYAAKGAGGNTHAVFEPHMDAGALEQLSLQHDLRQAVDQGQLQLHYQPKVDAKTGRAHGVEALLRWNHPARGMVSPSVFIPIAERYGLIHALGNWVIEEACRQMSAWAAHGLRLHMAINLSVHQLRQADIVQRIDEALRRHAIDPSQLLCEVTESTAMEEIKDRQRTLDGFKRIGVFLSIDDFGTGYSSLSYLRQLPASQLKIDRTFIADLEISKDARAIVSAILRLSHELGLSVVAEGVETDGQRAILVDLGCDELQGYLIARPMPAAALVAWIDGQPGARAAESSRVQLATSAA